MRFLLVICLLFSVTLPAQAISRHDARSLSCGQIRAIINSEGEAIIRYPSSRTLGLVLYDRFVANDRFCDSHEATERITVPARNGMCRIRHCISAPDRCGRLFRSPGRRFNRAD